MFYVDLSRGWMNVLFAFGVGYVFDVFPQADTMAIVFAMAIAMAPALRNKYM